MQCSIVQYSTVHVIFCEIGAPNCEIVAVNYVMAWGSWCLWYDTTWCSWYDSDLMSCNKLFDNMVWTAIDFVTINSMTLMNHRTYHSTGGLVTHGHNDFHEKYFSHIQNACKINYYIMK